MSLLCHFLWTYNKMYKQLLFLLLPLQLKYQTKTAKI